MEVVKYVKDMLRVQEGSIADTGIDAVLDLAPYIGNAYQTFRIKKLEIRLNKNDLQLIRIREKVEQSENEVLYKEQVFPLILKQLTEDDEDLKAKVVIDGFEHIVDENLYEIEKIYHFYDVLEELRMADIYLLASKYYPRDYSVMLKLRVPVLRPKQSRFSEEVKEIKSIKTYQQNKLQRLGLLEEQINIKMNVKTRGSSDNEHIEKSYTLSDFGKRFIDFFNIREITNEE